MFRMAVCLLLLHVTTITYGQEPRNLKVGRTVDAVRGMASLTVLVEEFEHVRTFSKRTIQTAVELKLRQNGIDVQDGADAILLPYLHVLPTILEVRDQTQLVYSVQLYFRRGVSIMVPGDNQNSYVIPGVPVWSHSITGITPVRSEENIKKVVDDLVDEFLNLYLTANPRRD